MQDKVILIYADIKHSPCMIYTVFVINLFLFSFLGLSNFNKFLQFFLNFHHQEK